MARRVVEAFTTIIFTIWIAIFFIVANVLIFTTDIRLSYFLVFNIYATAGVVLLIVGPIVSRFVYQRSVTVPIFISVLLTGGMFLAQAIIGFRSLDLLLLLYSIVGIVGAAGSLFSIVFCGSMLRS